MGIVNEAYEGFVTAAAIAPMVSPGNCRQNATRLFGAISAAEEAGAKVICAPELSVTGYTCGDLFWQNVLLEEALAALRVLVGCSARSDALIFVGLPLRHGGDLYNVAAAISGGRLLGLVPKTWIPNHGGYSELRHFTTAPPAHEEYTFDGEPIPFGTDLLFQCEEYPDLTVAAEISEDLGAPSPPSAAHARSGATVIVNLSATDESVGKDDYRHLLARSQSSRAVCAYIYSNAGYGESTGEQVFSGHSLIYENAELLGEKRPFESGFAIADIDVGSLVHDRQSLTTFSRPSDKTHRVIKFSQTQSCRLQYRRIEPKPFVPANDSERIVRCDKVLRLQTFGLMRRLDHAKAGKAVIGLSGGLDSALALLVSVSAMHLLGKPASDVIAISMPGPGTSHDTRMNARHMGKALGVNFREIDIGKIFLQHLRDIDHSEKERDVVYENAQARIRTLILMNIANKCGGLVVGTGDMSELALGWATYGGDQLSMYGVNAGVPKTLLRHIIKHVADRDKKLKSVLNDILGTPISPELLPPGKGGRITQMTEELIGPYELHDFFLYHAIRRGRTPSLVLKLAIRAFAGKYSDNEIRDTLRRFYQRFFANQFKRNALADGPKIGSVSLSASSDWRMPSDIDSEPWTNF
ncbi:MAG: NAD(+) synthase [Clostridiales bacterium]|nr:NAD(+) synthase [Clostridiales bacterium]